MSKTNHSSNTLPPLNINLNVAGHPISMSIDREDEPSLRMAEKEVNHYFGAYKDKFPNASDAQILAFTSLHIANLLSKLRASCSDNSEVMDKIRNINQLFKDDF